MVLREMNHNSPGLDADETLGVHELRITRADAEKAAQLNGFPVVKQLTFRGDDSVCSVDVRFRMLK